MNMIKVSKIKNNPKNPRVIKDDKFKKLVKSIKDFPEMMEKRPIVIDSWENPIILGGNMRFKAIVEAGYSEVPENWITTADGWTEDQKNEFIIKDNVSGGEWDFEQLANEWDVELLNDWGMEVPEFSKDVDYSILDEEDMSDQMGEMTSGVKKAIQIEFEAEHYEEAFELVKYWRGKDAYVGGMIMKYLKSQKEKL